MNNYLIVHDNPVFGIDLDRETRCIHYDSPIDVIAIRFHCCQRWYACIHCHTKLVDHSTELWPRGKFDVKALLCGCCGFQLTINAYLECDDTCPNCHHGFNPGCKDHHHLYFETLR